MGKIANLFLTLGILLVAVVSCGPSPYQEAKRRQAEVVQQNAHTLSERWARLKKGMTEEEVYELIPEAAPIIRTPEGFRDRPLTIKSSVGTFLFDRGELSSWSRK